MQTVSLSDKLTLFYSEVSDGNMDDRFSVAKEVKQNRQTLFASLNLNFRDAIEPAQIHFDRLLVLNEENTKMWRGVNVTGIDGFVTKTSSAILMVRVADCVPVILYDPVNHALGLFHAGWRGVVKGIVTTGLSRMTREFKTEAKDVLVWLGPSARFCHYTIAAAPEQASDPLWQPYITQVESAWRVDMAGFIKASLHSAGVLKSHLKDSNLCTVESANFFSHQRSQASGEPEGRFIVAAKLA